MAEVTLTVNGRPQTVDVDPSLPLLYVLRNDLELDSPKYGCGFAQCGACTVMVDGEAVRSCVTPVSTVEGAEVTTNEGLGTPEAPNPLQAAFVEEQAAQCGYCVSGIVMSAQALLEKNPDPSEAEIREALAGNLCRCGTHKRMIAAVKRAAAQGVGA